MVFAAVGVAELVPGVARANVRIDRFSFVIVEFDDARLRVQHDADVDHVARIFPKSREDVLKYDQDGVLPAHVGETAAVLGRTVEGGADRDEVALTVGLFRVDWELHIAGGACLLVALQHGLELDRPRVDQPGRIPFGHDASPFVSELDDTHLRPAGKQSAPAQTIDRHVDEMHSLGGRTPWPREQASWLPYSDSEHCFV